VPLLAVRAISDTMDESLPPFDRFTDSDGKWLVKDALRYFLVTPGELVRIPGIFWHAQQATRSLTAFLHALVPVIDG
jgi:hypothetical protein